MPVKFDFKESRLMVWLLCHQCHNLVSRCEEVMSYSKEITPQQHGVLMVIKCANDPVKPTDVARWLDRRTHSISLIIERMQKSGLVKCIRDLPDRRSVRLVMTKKGEKNFSQATDRGWKLICEILSDFSEDELKTLARLMGKVRDKAFNYLQPGDTMEEIKTNEAQNMVRFLSKIS
jgi:DNA-binding MarR family transcriptional regulator